MVDNNVLFKRFQEGADIASASDGQSDCKMINLIRQLTPWTPPK